MKRSAAPFSICNWKLTSAAQDWSLQKSRVICLPTIFGSLADMVSVALPGVVPWQRKQPTSRPSSMSRLPNRGASPGSKPSILSTLTSAEGRRYISSVEDSSDPP